MKWTLKKIDVLVGYHKNYRVMGEFIQVLRITPQLYRAGKWPMVYDPFGGLQTQVWRITKELDKSEISQTVLTGHIPGYPRHSKQGDSIQVESVGLALPEFVAPRFLGITWFIAVAGHLIKNRNNYNLVHIHYNEWIWCRILALLAKGLRLPVAVSINTELWVTCKFRWLVAGTRFNLSRWIEGKTISWADRVIVLTEKDATHWKSKLKLNSGKITVIPDAINVEKFTTPINPDKLNDFRQRFGIPKNKKVVTYIGRIRAEKGWQDLPKITRSLQHSDTFMLICGDGPDRRELEKAMREIRQEDKWCITGYLTPDEVRKALKIADLLILPSRNEVLGSVLLEAMASRVPAVAYEVGGTGEVSGKYGAVQLIAPADHSALTQAILEILDDSQKYEHYVKQGQIRVKDFSLQWAARVTLDCYQQLFKPAVAGKIQLDKSPRLEP